LSDYVDRLMAEVIEKNPGEPEFHQAVQEVAPSIDLLFEARARVPRRPSVFERHDRAGTGS
jgi:glutamate dehydrogenase (NADP+)